jgi:hypothetical protein
MYEERCKEFGIYTGEERAPAGHVTNFQNN